MMLSKLNELRVKYPEHRIFPLKSTISNPPYDIGIDLDHHYYRGQVKATVTMTPEGRMVFETSRFEKDVNGKSHRVPYTAEDIDFFLLYCADEESGPWYGLALLEECPMSTTVCKHGKMFKDSRRADDMDFEKRIRELIETGTIKPLPFYAETEIVEKEETEESAPVFKKPESDTEFLNLLAEYKWSLQELSDATHVSVPTLEKWRDEFCYT